ncbi:MAG TPA: head-tail connector protein [Hyphomicrobiaceae bacterium]|nr:head-tail connector protein [Hyphomicrobiaceae bacterium]
MSLVLASGPATEPVSVAEAKAHLRVDHTAEDPFIGSLIVTSRLHIEAALGLALITQSWSYFIDRFPRSGELVLPMRPVQSVSAVRIWQSDDTSAAAPASAYLLDGTALPPRLVWCNAPFPTAGRRAKGIEVAMTVGYGPAPADVPAPISHALLLLIAHWYEHREPIEVGEALAPIPVAVSELLAPYRARHL